MQIAMPFFSYLNKFVPISDEEFQKFIQPYLVERKFEKKEIVSKTGEVENHLNFIIAGLARKYYLQDNDEVNTQISHEGHIIHAQESFHSRKPSEYFVETLVPTTFVSMSYNDLEKFYSHDIKFERLGRLVITYTMVQNTKIIIFNIYVNVGKNKFVFNELPDNPGHFISVKLYNGVSNFNFLIHFTALFY